MNQLQSINFLVQPGGSFKGSLRVPGDKSISHRALMLGALADGDTLIEGFLESEDTLATRRALQQMGVKIESEGAKRVRVQGVGLHGLDAAGKTLDLGNSGTSVRLLAGLLSGQHFDSTLTGDESLMQRPMQRVVAPLQQMGADIECSKSGTLPVRIKGNRVIHGIDYNLPVASAQLKSALLLAGLYADKPGWIREPAVTRDHTERMLTFLGCRLTRQDGGIRLDTVELKGQAISIPADISSAAFFMVAAAICPGSDLILEGVGVNPTRHAVIEILEKMGAQIELRNMQEVSGEPVADIRVRSSSLKGIEIPAQLVPIAIDEIPVLMIAAACAEGDTVIREAEELRVKESDRIHAMCRGLERVGIEVEEFEDGMRVRGGKILGGEIDSFADHRIAMSFAVAGLVASKPTKILNCENVNTSFPEFQACFEQSGAKLQLEQPADE